MQRSNENADEAATEIQRAGEDLFNYAIDREEVKYLLAQHPEESSIAPAKVEYELQLLKIITVGWSLSYYLQESTAKNQLLTPFWQSIRQFSDSLSETTDLMIGQQIDYFNTLKERLDHYVAVLGDHPQATEPVAVIGPEFAACCGNRDDIFTLMAGAKMFSTAALRVKQYLTAANVI
jgi:hypothetical protein